MSALGMLLAYLVVAEGDPRDTIIGGKTNMSRIPAWTRMEHLDPRFFVGYIFCICEIRVWHSHFHWVFGMKNERSNDRNADSAPMRPMVILSQ